MSQRVLTRDDARSFIRSSTEKLKLPLDYSAIGDGSLAGFSQVKELIIPEGYEKVESHAFFMRSFKNTCKIERLTIPASLTEFDIWAFYDCTELRTISVPEDFSEQLALELFFHAPFATLNFGKKMFFPTRTKTVQQIMDETPGIMTAGHALSIKIENSTLTIPSKFFGIAPHALRSLAGKGVRRVVLPKTIRLAAPNVFADLPELEEVYIEDGTEFLDNYLFAKCKRLRYISLPNSITRVGAGVFMECPALQNVKLPKALTSISEEMFSMDTALKAVGFGSSIKRIGAGAFNGCTSLRSMMLPDGLEFIGISVFWDCVNLDRLYIPPTVTTISTSALGNCPAMTMVYMPKVINDALETKRIFGENTNPSIQWIDEDFDRSFFPDLTDDADTSFAVPAISMNAPTAQSLAAPPKQATPANAADAETVNKLEQTIAEMQQQILNLSKQAAAAQVNADQPVIDQQSIQMLNENLAAMRDQFASVSDIQQSTASLNAVQAKVEEIATMQADVQQKVESISDIQKSADTISDMREKIDAISDIQQKVTEISSAQDNLQEKVSALTDIQEKVSAISDVQEKVSALSDVSSKVDAISDIQEKVSAISDVQEKIDAISDIQEKVSAISDVQEKVDAISDIQEKVSAISDVQEKVEAISDTQADMNKRVNEMAVGGGSDSKISDSAFDARIALVPVQRGNYHPDDRVFTHEISKSIAGPKERSAELKQYSIIGSRSFLETEGGERFEIPEGVRRVETQGFWNAPRLLALELPHSLTEVEPDAFSGCSRLTDVYLCDEFPERRAAEYFLFRPEVKLHWPKKSFFSREKVVTVAELLEKYDDILTAEKVRKYQVSGHILQIPEGYTIIAPDMAKGIDCREDEPEHILKTIFLPRSARRIAAKAFTGLESVLHIVIPNGLQIVDMNAFTGCLGPYRIVLPDTVSYIGPYAFAEPSRYEQIRLPKTIQYLSENAFSNCGLLASLRISNSVKFIGECALSGCTTLTSLTVPKRFSEELPSILDGPVKINVRWTEEAKDDYKQTPSADFLSVCAPDFPPTAETRLFTQEMSASAGNYQERLSLMYQHPCIATLGFTDMANQTKFEIPLGIQRLCTNAFGNNGRLLTLTIPKALNEFEYEAFKGCERLRDVSLPDEFDKYAAAVLFMQNPSILLSFGGTRPVRVRQLLQECPWVLSPGEAAELDANDGTLTVPNGYVVIASFVYHGVMGITNLQRIFIPPSAKLIGKNAFVQLKALEEVVCAEGLQGIESEAFSECPELKRVVLPTTLKHLGENVFNACPKLDSVVLPKSLADRAEEIRMSHPDVKIEWSEDNIEKANETLQTVYASMIQNASNIDAELLEACDPFDVPYRQERGEGFADPIETSVTDENAIEGEVYQQIETQETPLLGDGTVETTEEATADDVPESVELPKEMESADDLTALDGVSVTLSDAEDEPEVENVAALDSLDGSDVAQDTEEFQSVEEIDSTDESASDVIPSVDETASMEESDAADEIENAVDESTEESVIDEVQSVEEVAPVEERSVLEEITNALDEIENAVTEPSEESVIDEVLSTEEIAPVEERSVLEEITNALDEIENAVTEPSEESVIDEVQSVEEIAPVEERSVLEEITNALDEIENAVTEPSEEPTIDEVQSVEEIAPVEEQSALEEITNALDEIENITEEPFVSVETIAEETVDGMSEIADSLFATIETAPPQEDPEFAPTLETIAPAEISEEIESVADTLFEDAPMDESTSENVMDEPQQEESVPEEIDAVADSLFEDTESGEETSSEISEDDTVSEEEDAESKISALADELFPEQNELDGMLSEIGSVKPTLAMEELVLNRSDDDIPLNHALFGQMPVRTDLLSEIDETENALIAKPSEHDLKADASLPSLEEIENVANSLFEGGFSDSMDEGFFNEAKTAEIPADGRLTAKERRRWYHGEFFFEIPEGYREIRAGACSGLDKLERLIIAESVEKIGNGAFADCNDLTTVYIPSGVSEIAEDAFDSCEAISDVTMPRRFEERAAELFESGPHFTWLEEPVKIIGDGRFTAKIRAKVYSDEPTFKLPAGYTEVRAGACAGLDDMVELILPETLEKICAGAFADCSALETVYIPDSVTELAEDAFDGCDAIRKVTLPRHLEEIAKSCFPNVVIQYLED